MPGNVINRNYFFIESIRQSAREVNTNKQSDDKPRSMSNGDIVNIFYFYFRGAQRLLKTTGKFLRVRAPAKVGTTPPNGA